jgi:hypothetical protein
VQTHQINVSHGRERVREIRRELFRFSEVLDVFVTGRPDRLVVVCAGRPRLGEWLRALRAAGYEVPGSRRSTAAALRTERSQAAVLRHVVEYLHEQSPDAEQRRRPDAA